MMMIAQIIKIVMTGNVKVRVIIISHAQIPNIRPVAVFHQRVRTDINTGGFVHAPRLLAEMA